ncbi:MAG: 16S rRNA (adenine(1518)-N(6)/adenine(1519)-N(6))-dimethyltransferase RsmA [Patescibacteria group bacterium]|jgi:16S rRNA (adenine1518-N6/adenine1519-N6)-dimethyltransferase
MSIDLTDKEQLTKYLKSKGLLAKQSLGQNFLVDREVLEKIVEAAEIKTSDTVIEVGPGLGTLTEELILRAGKVIAIEKDDKLAKLLSSQFCHPELDSGSSIVNLDSGSQAAVRNDNLVVLNSDILAVNVPELTGGKPYKVVANIPYYITAKIIKLFLTSENKPESIVLLVQKEVAERICAKPGQLSILALSVQAFGEPEIVSVVKRDSFFPAPAVDSAILRIRIQNSEFRIQPEDERELFRLIHIGFASKRKTLINNLSAGLRIDKKAIADIIKSIGLGENARAQELSLEEWKKLSLILKLK